MKILGISGLEQSVPFKKAYFPGLEEREYRISQGHDSAAALIVDGTLVAAAAEERFDRMKHSPRFPVSAIQYCLREAHLQLDEIDLIAHAFDYRPYQRVYYSPESRRLFGDVYSREALLAQVRRDLPGFPEDRVCHVSHHLAHAASAYFTSGWEQCLTMVVDAMGEAHSASVYLGREGRLELLAQIGAFDSIGILYSLITLHLGFEFNSDEYKIMGLAPYGDPQRFRSFFEEEVTLGPGGTVRIPMLRLNRDAQERESHLGTRRYLEDRLIPARTPEGPLLQIHSDVAAALQECLERTMLHLCTHFAQVTGTRKLALAGGVALNCAANGVLRKSGRFDDIYIQPAAGDDGAALGAALHYAAQSGEARNVRLSTPYLGPAYSARELQDALAEFEERIEVEPNATLEETCAQAARLIADGRVVAWYRGRMEFGPRALGHRSILADPGHPEMRDRINSMVKMREAFRPFAPAVSVEEVHRWFDVPPGTEMPYMTITVEVRQEVRDQLPAITHLNGSARVQTVSESDDPAFHKLLKEVGLLTGREMVLNTSFNVKGQPIVNTPREAIETFLSTGIEYLFLENCRIVRRAVANSGPVGENWEEGAAA